jgi:hypothetical protein
MAKKTGLGNQLYVAGYDLSGDISNFEISSPRNVVDVTSINKSANERLLTTADGAITFNTFFNDAALAEHVALKAVPSTDRVTTFLMGSTANDPACGLVAKQLNYDMTRTADGGLNFSIDLQSQGYPVEWGTSLVAGKVTHSSATNVASLDQSSSSSDGSQAYLQAFSISSGDAVIKVQHSSDNSSWADLITFTTVSALTSERGTSTGTVNRYVRAQSSGTFSNVVFSLIFRRGESTDII